MTLPEVQPFHDYARVLAVGDLAVVVFHSPIASGVTVWGVALATGEIRWRSDPPGIGPVTHSKYRNRVAVSVPGHLVIHG